MEITAGAGDVLSGKVIVDQDGNPITGTIPVKNAIASSINCGGLVDIPAGYYPTAGKVQANSLASQTAANAGAGQILSGYSGWVNGSKVNGSMTNRGAWTGSVGTNGTTYIPAGYHNGSGYINNSQATMGGGTYTPSTSQQTVWCNGRLMTGNIVINAIPSEYVNPTTGAIFFSRGSYGPMADLGAYSNIYYTTRGWSNSPTYLSAQSLANGTATMPSFSVRASDGGRAYGYVVFRRCIPVTKFKRIVATCYIDYSYNEIAVCLIDRYISIGYGYAYATGSGKQTVTLTMEIPSNLDTSKDYCIALRQTGTGNVKFRLDSLIGYAS